MAKILPLTVQEPTPPFRADACRLESLSRQWCEDGLAIRHDATIVTGQRSYPVRWERPTMEPLCIGTLYAIEWDGWPADGDGPITIGNLVPLSAPNPTVNLFHTVPQRWLPDRRLADRGAILWAGLPSPFQMLFNAIFWDGVRFEHYVCGPSSRDHHHNTRNGNLRHSLEVADIALDLARYSGIVDRDVLILAALLHDAAKAEQYRFGANSAPQGWTEEGSMLGHRIMVSSWIEAAVAAHQISVPPRQLLALKHVLLATENAAWTGFPVPRMLEAQILATADRYSATADIFARCAPEEGGFGVKHSSMKYPPYYSSPALPSP